MAETPLTIGFARRGYSPSGGAEAYLSRLAGGAVQAGHAVRLFTTQAWPESRWTHGDIIRVDGETPIAFADQLRSARRRCDVLVSLERVWQCDVYRAGDGVHAAWLRRRAAASGMLANLFRSRSAKHRHLLRLEEALFARGGTRRVIANSQMVKREITEMYSYPASQIEIIYNGVPTERLADARRTRSTARSEIGLQENEVAVLFVGSGWQRKGVRVAQRAIEQLPGDFRLLVVGRGNRGGFRSSRAQFLGEIADPTPLYGAADIFLLPTLYDPFSNAALEALAAGLPVITTSSNGVAEIMQSGANGEIIEDPLDVAAFASALKTWSDPEMRERARTSNLALAQRFDVSANVAQTLQLLLALPASAASTFGKM